MKPDWRQYSGLFSDSRKVTEGSVFFCVPKSKAVSEKYINQAIDNGAKLIVVEEGNEAFLSPAIVFSTTDIHQLMSEAASEFYSKKPSHIAAVTGTNGKTSTVAFVAQMIELLGQKASTIGTLGIGFNGSYVELENTTPGALDMADYLNKFADNGIDYAVFEASSHALDQHRIDFIKPKAAGFTNLTQDHLDYHKDMASYLKAKKRLFFDLLDSEGVAVLNADDESFWELSQCGRKVISYGWNGSDIRLSEVSLSGSGQKIKLELFGKIRETLLPVSGDFQVMNALCALGLMIGLGFNAEESFSCLAKLSAPNGRMDFVAEHNGALIYVDYAHTPDALEKAIQSLRPYAKNKMKVLFGCGGDRDKTKRPIMGRIASKQADVVYVTDDNPRTENAVLIRKEVLNGVSNNAIDAGNRSAALALAVKELEPGDVLLVAGKGHENYQVIGTEKIHFDDKEEILKNLS